MNERRAAAGGRELVASAERVRVPKFFDDFTGFSCPSG